MDANDLMFILVPRKYIVVQSWAALPPPVEAGVEEVE